MNDNFNQLNETEIKEKLYFLDKTIKTLDWDNRRNQINPAKKVELEELKKEFFELKSKVNTIGN